MRLRQMCEIAAKGHGLYRFTDAVRQSTVICLEQHCKDGTFYCRIYKKDLPELERIAAAYGIELTCRTLRSLSGFLARFRTRWGIGIGLVCGVLLIFYYSNIVTTIEIRGNTSVSDRVILTALEREGVGKGTWIGSIDFNHCQRRLRLAIPNLTWVGMRHTGSRLVVEVAEITPKIEMLEERVPCNIVSMYDAQITDVTIYNGHLVRLIGDGVSEGELLVSGVFQDDKGHTTYHHAIAEITGIYTKEVEFSEYFVVSTTEETGRQFQSTGLECFHLTLPLGLQTPSFSTYREVSTTTPFVFLGRTLPFSLHRQTYYETTDTVQIRSEEETRLAVNAAIVRFEKNLLQDVEILERQADYRVDADGVTCHLTYTLQGEIGRVAEVFIK